MVKQSTTKKKSTTTKRAPAKKPASKSSTASKKTSKAPSEPFRPLAMTIAISALSAVTLFGFAMISIL